MATIDGKNTNDILNGTASADTIYGHGGDDWLKGHAGNDIIYGGSGNDILDGGAGNDILFGDSDSNSLFGGSESDILVSGTGSDHMNGGSGVDAASWQDSNVEVTASLLTGRAFAGGVEDTLTQIENLIGSRFDDRLYGNKGSNGLFGGEGHDKLYGNGGSDELSGGAGNELLDGGTGFNKLRGGTGVDTVDYVSQQGAIHADMGSKNLIGFDRHDVISEIEVIRGSNFADTFIGDAFGNQLFGNGGNDVIDGGQGNDMLTGGTGADTFVFVASTGSRFSKSTDSGFDRIADFDRAEGDLIDLTRHKEATDFATLRAEANQLGGDTHLLLGADTIVIEDVTLSELRSDMFLF